MSKIFSTIFFAISMLFSFELLAQEKSADYSSQVTAIENNFQNALRLHANKEFEDASAMIADTYFEIFEGMEAAIAIRSPSLKTELESEFGELRSLLSKPNESELLAKKTQSLITRIRAAAFQLEGSESWWDKFLSSFLIILREGFEAILIVGAITAFLVKTNNHSLLYLVRNSTLVAIGLSFVLAFLFQVVFRITAAQQELVEGITMIFASGVLFLVGHWLISHAESQHWMKYVKNQLQGAIGVHSKRAIWMTCFLAVFREGAETVLFYQALFASSGPSTVSSIIAGFLVGCACLVLIYALYKKSTLKIPMKPFFRITSALLYFLSITIAGKAIIELQAGGYLGVSTLPSLPTISWLGFYPTLQNVVLQGLLLLALLSSVGWVYVRRYYASLKPNEMIESSMSPSLKELK